MKCVYRIKNSYAVRVVLGDRRYYRGRFATEYEAEAWLLQAQAAHKLGHPIPLTGPGPRVLTPVHGGSIPPQSKEQKGFNAYFSIGGRSFKALSRLRQAYKNMSVLQAMCLFYIAQNREVAQQSLCQDIGITTSVASQVLHILSQYPKRGAHPLRLITVVENPADRRFRLLSLTAKGKRLIDDIRRDIDGDWHDTKPTHALNHDTNGHTGH